MGPGPAVNKEDHADSILGHKGPVIYFLEKDATVNYAPCYKLFRQNY